MSEYTRLYFIRSTINGRLGCFQVLPITNSVAMNVLVQYVSFGEDVYTLLLGIVHRNRLAGSKVCVCSVSAEAAKTSSKVMVTIDIPTCKFLLLYISPTCGIVCFFYVSHSGRCIVLLHCDFNLYFPDYL